MILQRKHVENFYFQKQYCELLALNNMHFGAKLNRDQTINKFIQNTIEKASEKIEKPIKTFTVQAARARIRPGPLGAHGARAFSPAADGQAAKSAQRGAPLGPFSARSPPRRP